jgi:hypothetical protein
MRIYQHELFFFLNFLCQNRVFLPVCTEGGGGGRGLKPISTTSIVDNRLFLKNSLDGDSLEYN